MSGRPFTSGDLAASAILGLLGTRGPASRADIARALQVSPATVTALTKSLLARGLITELAHQPSNGGRPARLIGLKRSAGGAIGAKVTATHIAVVDVALDGVVNRSTSASFDPQAPDALDALGHVLADAIERHEGQLLGVGVGVPGSVDSQASGTVDAPTLGWSDMRVGTVLRAQLGVPVLVENDVNTLAVAERLYGTGRQHQTYLVITIGRGIGCGIVVNGAVYRGAGGGAGEIGHVAISSDGPPCPCGLTGCLEAHIGQDALVRAGIASGALTAGASVEDLRRLADAGEARARLVYHHAGELLGRALAGVVHLIDPEVVVLLGEGIDAWPHWEPGFEPSFRRHLMPSRRGLPFMVEPWAEDKWALGAASLIFATPFDATGEAGDQGRLVRQRLHAPLAGVVSS